MNNLLVLRFLRILGYIAFAGLVIAVVIFPVYVFAVVALLVLALTIQYWRIRRRNEARGWRLRFVSRGDWTYEEKRNGAWVGFKMSEQKNASKSPQHLLIKSSPRWTEYPEWTHGRREEILARISSQLKEPYYVLIEA
jgi:hypothetical protein